VETGESKPPRTVSEIFFLSSRNLRAGRKVEISAGKSKGYIKALRGQPDFPNNLRICELLEPPKAKAQNILGINELHLQWTMRGDFL